MLDLNDFVSVHERALLNFALQLTRSEDDADDLLQDTWIKCFPHQQLLETLTIQKQRSWLFTVLKNRWLDICRHRKLEHVVCSGCEPSVPGIIPVYKFEPHLEKLPRLDREILQLKFWHELNSREISAELGIPEGTVRWRLKCALDKLREYIEQSDKEERCQL